MTARVPISLAFRLQAILVRALFALFAALPVDTASALGGWLGRKVGPRLKGHRLAERHLRLALPDLPERRRRTILAGMWDNLGRTFAEYPHLPEITDPVSGRVELFGEDTFREVESAGTPIILASGHLANFEVMPLVAAQRGVTITVLYRPPNNPLVDAMLARYRGAAGGNLVAKSLRGTRRAFDAVRRGEPLALLVDQHFTQGLDVPFFGQPARTVKAPAQMALREGCAILPIRLERLGGAYFRMTVRPPLEIPHTGDDQADMIAITAALNGLLERWIRDRPDQWLWMHRRWRARR